MSMITKAPAQAITEQDRQILELMAQLGDAEQVFFCEIMKGLIGGSSMESMLIHQAHEYKAMQSAVNLGQIDNALPLMRYIQARWGDMGDMALVLGMAYQAGIADGKRIDRQRRAHK